MLSTVRPVTTNPVTGPGAVTSGGAVSKGGFRVHTYFAVTLTVRPARTFTLRFENFPLPEPLGLLTG